MTIEEYRVKLGWSKARLAREAGIDVSTLNDAMAGKRIYKATASRIARAISEGLGQEITYQELDGVTTYD